MSSPSLMQISHHLRDLLTREEKTRWLRIVIIAIFSSLLEVVTAFSIMVLAQALNNPSAGHKYLLHLGMDTDISPGRMVFYVAVGVGIIYVIKNTIAALEVFYQNFSIQGMNYALKNRLIQGFSNASYARYLTQNSSHMMQIVRSDSEEMFVKGMVPLANIISEACVLVFLVSAIIYMNPMLAFGLFVSAAVLGLIVTKLLLPRFYSWGKQIQQLALENHKQLGQIIHAFKEMILSRRKDSLIDVYNTNSKRRLHLQAIQTSINATPRIGIEIVFMGFFVFTVAYLCLDHETPSQMLGLLGGYLYAGFRIMPGLNRIINQLNIFKSIFPCIERVHEEYMANKDSVNCVDVPEFSFKHSISLTDVSFSYPNTEAKALHDVTLTIQKHECLGIIGETGSGKSTLIDIILGLLTPSSGHICIDDAYPTHAGQWHAQLGYVPQHVYLIDDTIAANIAFGEKTVDTTALKAAIEAAQLNTLMASLPQKEHTIVGERGIRLSGGERQRIAIARALYANPDVLIFDEATSALDNETEAKLIETINTVSQHRTVIMIAHRLTTLKHCDRIVIMDKGTISKITHYDELQ